MGITGGLASDGRGHYGSYGGTTSTYSSGNTPLAKSLAAPILLTLNDRRDTEVLIFVLLFPALLSLVGLSFFLSSLQRHFERGGYYDYMLLSVIAFVAGVWAIFGVLSFCKKADDTARRERPRVLREIELWKKLVFCEKCDCVTDSSDGRHQRRESWRTLVHSPLP